ncbi:hypothetical protein GJ496_010770 [Pomphorhynchus laevis]|nr:hypothetical protein GJ496_010770 [Pomphorhynchus laevis]
MANAEIINLIREVYEVGHTSPSRCEELSQIQKSDEAWTVCSEILKYSVQQNLSVPVVTFAALTLKRKIKKDLNSLSKENHDPLKELIIKSVITYATCKPIRTQLCLALVYLVIQSDKWNDPIVTITSCLPDGDHKAIIILEYFTILADELTSLKDVKIKHIRRDQLRRQLNDLAPDVNQFLLSLLCQRHEDINFLCDIINCYTIWIDGQLIDEKLLITSDGNEVQLLPFLFKHLLEAGECSEDLHDSCTECMCSLLQICGENLGVNRNILVKANNVIVSNFPRLLGSVNQWTQEVTKPVFNLLKILVSLGYSLQNVYRLNIPDIELNDTRVLQCLLEYTKCKHYDVSYTFLFLKNL